MGFGDLGRGMGFAGGSRVIYYITANQGSDNAAT